MLPWYTLAMARIIAIANQKGGVGKTSTTINLGAGLANRGRAVTLIDLDPQASLTHALGFDPDGLEETVYNVLLSPTVPLGKVMVKANAGVSLAPANIDLAGAEFELPATRNWERTLKLRLEVHGGKEDFILIDCPTSLGVLTINALVAADELLVPTECSFLAFRGLSSLLKTFVRVKRRFNPGLKMLAIVPVKVGHTLHAREAMEQLRRLCGSWVSEVVVPQRVAVADAVAAGQSVLEFAPKSDAAEAFRRLTEVVDNG